MPILLKSYLSESEKKKISFQIFQLTNENIHLRIRIKDIQEAKPWYPVQRIAAKIGNNQRRITQLQEMLEGKYV